jgi:16S rRNA (uracil1498-N3)-methyltransferase
MLIEPILTLEDIDVSAFEQPLVLWEGEKSTRLDATMISYDGPMSLLIGPEGGFQEEEINRLKEKNFTPVSLGTRILRSETAALSSIAILQFLSGSLSPVRG